VNSASAAQRRIKRIAVIPGDGIGKEVVPEAVRILAAAVERANHEAEFVEFDWGADRFLRDGTT
jgi:isocitrate/isopropylmalate dehydrogenase